MLFWLMVAVLYYPGWDAIIRWAVGQKVGETESKSEEDNKKSVADVLPDDVGKDKVVIPSESGSDSETKLPKGSPVARPHEKATDNRKPVRTQKESRSVPGGVAQSQGGTGGTARTPATTQGSVVKMETGTVRIFTRSESEHDNLALMVEEELEKIKPQISPQEVDPFRLPPARHLVGLAPGDMFIYYSDPKLEAVTKIIAQALKNLPAFKGPGRSIDQQTGLYPDGRRALQDHVTGMVGAKHILIILPEE
jgi:hypothetical protein